MGWGIAEMVISVLLSSMPYNFFLKKLKQIYKNPVLKILQFLKAKILSPGSWQTEMACQWENAAVIIVTSLVIHISFRISQFNLSNNSSFSMFL
jgi:hypothetical protein